MNNPKHEVLWEAYISRWNDETNCIVEGKLIRIQQDPQPDQCTVMIYPNKHAPRYEESQKGEGN